MIKVQLKWEKSRLGGSVFPPDNPYFIQAVVRLPTIFFTSFVHCTDCDVFSIFIFMQVQCRVTERGKDRDRQWERCIFQPLTDSPSDHSHQGGQAKGSSWEPGAFSRPAIRVQKSTHLGRLLLLSQTISSELYSKWGILNLNGCRYGLSVLQVSALPARTQHWLLSVIF